MKSVSAEIKKVRNEVSQILTYHHRPTEKVYDPVQIGREAWLKVYSQTTGSDSLDRFTWTVLKMFVTN